jgi:hydroxyethylthiazole kinase-like uncharacterized protein yjeF
MRTVRDVRLADMAKFPLPPLDQADDKEGRGGVLVVAGSAMVPGAAILTGTAVLRAGAGKLQLAASAQGALHLGYAMPEAAVIKVPATRGGDFGRTAAPGLLNAVEEADAIVIGPGLVDEAAAAELVTQLFKRDCRAAVVLDAAAMTGLDLEAPSTRKLDGRLVLTPHAGEMAALLGRSKEAVLDDPLDAARILSDALQAVVVMKGAETFVVAPQGQAYSHKGGVIGLATSGSGDVLAGLIGGLLARGAAPLPAALWGVCAHAGAGARLSERIGAVGFLAREILAELPRVLVDAA